MGEEDGFVTYESYRIVSVLELRIMEIIIILIITEELGQKLSRKRKPALNRWCNEKVVVMKLCI